MACDAKKDVAKKFEDLANELIYEIFNYLDGLVLYRAFFGLNRRINGILETTSKINVRINSPIDASDLLLDRFADRVYYLILPRPDFIDATRFTNVHSLEFYDFLSQESLRRLHPIYFPRLVYLRMCYVEDSSTSLTFYQLIFSNAFPFLRKCILEELPPFDASCRWSSSPSILVLTINGMPLTTYFHVLISCPNLRHLHWSHVRYTDIDTVSIPFVYHIALRRLYIRTINLSMIRTVLSCLPHLRHLHIVSDWSRGNNCLPLDFEELAKILIQCVAELNRFDCETAERNPIELNKIHDYHPCFRAIRCKELNDGRKQFFTDT